MRRPTATERESIRHSWSDLIVVLVQAYQGSRRSMWERIPNMMTSAARQTAGLDRWWTLLLRSLQIEKQGSASRFNSLSSAWLRVRGWMRALDLSENQDEVERYSLRLLRDEIATVSAQARLRWEEIKQMNKAGRSAKPSKEPDHD